MNVDSSEMEVTSYRHRNARAIVMRGTFSRVLKLLRIITRHDLLPYITLRKRRAACPDLAVDKLSGGNINSLRDSQNPGLLSPLKQCLPHYPVVRCPTTGSQMCSKWPAQGRTTLGSQQNRWKLETPDPKEKQTCDITLRVGEYCLCESALQDKCLLP